MLNVATWIRPKDEKWFRPLFDSFLRCVSGTRSDARNRWIEWTVCF